MSRSSLALAADTSRTETLSGFIGYRMKRAYLAIADDFNASLGGLNLRPATFAALSAIVENPDISQSTLSRLLAVERSNMVAVIDELERRALIARHAVPGDRRSYALRATLSGINAHRKAVRLIARHEERVLAPLSPAERETLAGLLGRIAGIAEPQEAVGGVEP